VAERGAVEKIFLLLEEDQEDRAERADAVPGPGVEEVLISVRR
jgi:hypothetical protein